MALKDHIILIRWTLKRTRSKSSFIDFEVRYCRGFKSSSPGEFHPQALTDPDVTVSRHPALIIQLPSSSNLALPLWLLPSLVDQKIRPDDPTPSLHLHYRDFNTTTSWSVPVPCIGTLTLMRSSHLSFSLTSGRQVPTFHTRAWIKVTPLLCRTPLGQSAGSPRAYPGVQIAPSFDVVHIFSTPHQWFACARLLEPHLTQSLPCLFLNAHHPGSLPAQLKVVWSLLLQAGSEGPPSSPM